MINKRCPCRPELNNLMVFKHFLILQDLQGPHFEGYRLACPTLSTNIMTRIWNTVPALQHATTLEAAKSLAKKWAKDIPR